MLKKYFFIVVLGLFVWPLNDAVSFDQRAQSSNVSPQQRGKVSIQRPQQVVSIPSNARPPQRKMPPSNVTASHRKVVRSNNTSAIPQNPGVSRGVSQRRMSSKNPPSSGRVVNNSRKMTTAQAGKRKASQSPMMRQPSVKRRAVTARPNPNMRVQTSGKSPSITLNTGPVDKKLLKQNTMSWMQKKMCSPKFAKIVDIQWLLANKQARGANPRVSDTFTAMKRCVENGKNQKFVAALNTNGRLDLLKQSNYGAQDPSQAGQSSKAGKASNSRAPQRAMATTGGRGGPVRVQSVRNARGAPQSMNNRRPNPNMRDQNQSNARGKSQSIQLNTGPVDKKLLKQNTMSWMQKKTCSSKFAKIVDIQWLLANKQAYGANPRVSDTFTAMKRCITNGKNQKFVAALNTNGRLDLLKQSNYGAQDPSQAGQSSKAGKASNSRAPQRAIATTGGRGGPARVQSVRNARGAPQSMNNRRPNPNMRGQNQSNARGKSQSITLNTGPVDKKLLKQNTMSWMQKKTCSSKFAKVVDIQWLLANKQARGANPRVSDTFTAMKRCITNGKNQKFVEALNTNGRLDLLKQSNYGAQDPSQAGQSSKSGKASNSRAPQRAMATTGGRADNRRFDGEVIDSNMSSVNNSTQGVPQRAQPSMPQNPAQGMVQNGFINPQAQSQSGFAVPVPPPSQQFENQGMDQEFQEETYDDQNSQEEFMDPEFVDEEQNFGGQEDMDQEFVVEDGFDSNDADESMNDETDNGEQMQPAQPQHVNPPAFAPHAMGPAVAQNMQRNPMSQNMQKRFPQHMSPQVQNGFAAPQNMQQQSYDQQASPQMGQSGYPQQQNTPQEAQKSYDDQEDWGGEGMDHQWDESVNSQKQAQAQAQWSDGMNSQSQWGQGASDPFEGASAPEQWQVEGGIQGASSTMGAVPQRMNPPAFAPHTMGAVAPQHYGQRNSMPQNPSQRMNPQAQNEFAGAPQNMRQNLPQNHGQWGMQAQQQYASHQHQQKATPQNMWGGGYGHDLESAGGYAMQPQMNSWSMGQYEQAQTPYGGMAQSYGFGGSQAQNPFAGALPQDNPWVSQYGAVGADSYGGMQYGQAPYMDSGFTAVQQWPYTMSHYSNMGGYNPYQALQYQSMMGR